MHRLIGMCLESWKLDYPTAPANGPGKLVEVLAGESSYSYALDQRMVLLSVARSQPLRPSAQLPEGRTWIGERRGGHTPGQADRPHQPWQSMWWQMSPPDCPHRPVCYMLVAPIVFRETTAATTTIRKQGANKQQQQHTHTVFMASFYLEDSTFCCCWSPFVPLFLVLQLQRLSSYFLALPFFVLSFLTCPFSHALSMILSPADPFSTFRSELHGLFSEGFLITLWRLTSCNYCWFILYISLIWLNSICNYLSFYLHLCLHMSFL